MIEFWRFKVIDNPSLTLLEGQYNYPLVVLSVLISSFAAYALLVVLKQTKDSDSDRSVRIWQLLGSIVFGLGVWAMHFTGMLAFILPVNMSYDAAISTASVFPAMLGCYMALRIMYFKQFTFWAIQLEGLSIALGIGCMHYLGMEAMQMDAMLIYDLPLFITSIISAHAMAVLAIYLMIQVNRFYEKRELIKVVSSCFMGGAVASMHYVAMAAASFYISVGSLLTSHHTNDNSTILSLNIAGVIFLLVAITAIGAMVEHRLRTAEKSVAESIQREKDIVDHLPDGLLTVDQNGLVIRANPMAYYMFEYDSGTMNGVSISQIVPSITAEYLLEDLRRIDSEVLDRTNIYDGVKHSGDYFPIEANFSSIKTGESNENIFNCLVRDITERSRLEDQLRQAQKLESIGQLAAGIAHEINTPTQYVSDNTSFLNTGFKGLTEVIDIANELAQKAPSSITKEDLDKINYLIAENDIPFLQSEIPLAIEQSLEGLGRITTIVSAMKSFSHSGGDAEMQHIDVAEAIESTVTVSRGEWKYVAELETEFEDTLPQIPCFRDELNQVILNFIVNAAHAIEEKQQTNGTEKGFIKIAVKKAPPYLMISISDNGSGMSDQVRLRIFDPFFTTKGVGKGTGQGLSLAYNVIVEKHKGNIEVKSEEGVGTTFIISIPLLHNLSGNDSQMESNVL